MAALADAGVPVGLGTSGGGSNDAGHLLADARLALQVAPLAGRPVSAREVLGWATAGGAEGLGRAELGRLEPGCAGRPGVLAGGRGRRRGAWRIRWPGCCGQLRAVVPATSWSPGRWWYATASWSAARSRGSPNDLRALLRAPGPGTTTRGRSALCVVGEALPVEHDAGLVADDPGVVTGRANACSRP